MTKSKRRQPQNHAHPSHWGGEPDPEECDPTPVEIPIGAKRPETMEEIIARMLHQHIAEQQDNSTETYEEANDFEEPADPGLLDFSPYELTEVIEEEPIGREPPSDPPQSDPPQQTTIVESSGEEPSEAPDSA